MEGGRFVVHEHHAKRAGLHYDLRLECGDSLKDWAFRKSLPLKPGVKRFGVQQPDHDRIWLEFEGEIEEGYGAGVMRIWDKGRYIVLSRTSDGFRLWFDGERMKGEYVMVTFKDGWLLFKP